MKILHVQREILQQITGFSNEDMVFIDSWYNRAKLANMIGIAIREISGDNEIWDRHLQDYLVQARRKLRVFAKCIADLKKTAIKVLIKNWLAGKIVLATLIEEEELTEEQKKNIVAFYRKNKLWEDIPTMLQELGYITELGKFCLDELSRRLLENPHTVELSALRDGMDEVLGKIFLPEHQGKSIQTILSDSLIKRMEKENWLSNLYLPKDDADKESLLYELALKKHRKFNTLTELLEACIGEKGEFKYFPNAFKNFVISELRKQTTKDEIPTEKTISLNATTPDGQSTILEYIENKHEEFQTSLDEYVGEILSQEQRRQLKELLGETGLKIIEYRLQHPENIKQHSEKKIIAQALDIAESTVGKYIGTKSKIGIIEEKAEEIAEIIREG